MINEGMAGYNYLYVTRDENQMIRRLDENGAHITDYLSQSYINKTIPDSVFEVPSYCSGPCPLTTICGKLRSGETVLKDLKME